MARTLQAYFALMPAARLRLAALVLVAALACAYAATAAWPVRYAASASVLLPPTGTPVSRVLRIEDVAADAHSALTRVQDQIRIHVSRKAQVIDAPAVRPQRPSLALNLALGGAAGLVLALLLALRRPRNLRLSPGSVVALGERLLAHWFAPERRMLALVGIDGAESRARLAVQLAAALAELGHRTLLIDGDLRAPSLHRELGLANRGGLAGLLERGRVDLARVKDNLSVVVAGEPDGDPLELLAQPRLRAFLADAREHFGVVLLHAPAAARGPDYQMFAALAGGALVIGDPERLHASLERCGAQVVATVGN